MLPSKLRYTQEELAKFHRFDLSWHIYQLIEKLLDSDNYVDIGLARILLGFMDFWYWVKYRSTIAWLYKKLNQIAAFLKLRDSINYNIEFWDFEP